MSRKRWLLTITLVTLAMAAMSVGPRARRTLAYLNQVSSPAAAAKLAIRPKMVKPTAPASTDTIDTLYSTFSVPSGVFTTLDSNGTWLVLAGRHEFEILLTEIGYPTELSADGNFTFYNEALSACPATGWAVFSMSDKQFASHVKCIAGKLATPYADRDVSVFKTPNVKGIIRYGSAERFPGVINIAIWDLDKPLFQEITVTVPDTELLEQTATCIAATYCFKLDVTPDRDKLLLLLKQAVASFNLKAGEQSREPERR